jgi:hypothetical protein
LKMYRGTCPNDGGTLFEVPGFDAISEKRPVELTCQHCQTMYKIIHKGQNILYRPKGDPATNNITAEIYG